MYKKASASAAAGGGTDAAGGNGAAGGAGETKTDEKVVDAEFEEVDKDKK
jgi:molecular chaperone DnaK